MAIEKANSPEELQDPRPFETLDFKLAAAFTRILGTSDLSRTIAAKEDLAQSQGRMLLGRQIGWYIWRHYSLNEADASILDINDLFNCHISKDNNLPGFMAAWEIMLNGQREMPHDQILESLFRNKVEKVPGLKETLAMYDMQHNQWGVQRSYRHLHGIVTTYVTSKQRDKNRQDMLKSQTTPFLTPVPKKDPMGVVKRAP